MLKGQTGQQLLLGAYSAMNRQIARGKIKMYNRHEMLDIVKVDSKARGIITRSLVNGEIERHSAHAVVLASGGYGNVFYLSTNAMGSNVTAAWKAHKEELALLILVLPKYTPLAFQFRNPPVQVNAYVKSLRNDGTNLDGSLKNLKNAKNVRSGKLKPTQILEEDRDYFLERRYPAFGNLVPRDVASRAAKEKMRCWIWSKQNRGSCLFGFCFSNYQVWERTGIG